MLVRQRGERFVVIDDFLPEDALAGARALMGRAGMREVASVVSPEHDGRARRSNGARFVDGAVGAEGPGRPPVYREIVRMVSAEEQVYGRRGADWDTVSFTYWTYPAGSRLNWHNDAGLGRTGEFVYFLHEQWRSSWGGELLVVDEDLRESAEDLRAGMSIDDRMESLLVRSAANPVAIIPWPNRLVMVKAGTVHTIRRVDHTAGAALRRTLTGFVSRKRGEPSARGPVREQWNSFVDQMAVPSLAGPAEGA